MGSANHILLCCENNLNFSDLRHMNKRILVVPIVLALAAIFSYFIGARSREFYGLPLLWELTAYSFLVQIVAFIPAWLMDTEFFYDLTGGITFISITLIATLTNPLPTTPQYLAAAMVGVRSLRLTSFLFLRIMKRGEDSRFVEIRASPIRFFVAWLLQGFWVIVTISPLLVVMTSRPKNTLESITTTNVFGVAIWALGLVTEVIADRQKSAFNADTSNKGRFITSGLWSVSRHPNYVGEVLVWVGAATFALSSLQGGEYVCLVSPLFVYLLLLKVSGVKILEQTAEKRWGSEKAYIQYKHKTPVFFPFFGGKAIKAE